MVGLFLFGEAWNEDGRVLSRQEKLPLEKSPLWKETGSKGMFWTHEGISGESLHVETALQTQRGRKEGRYMQVWLEMSFTKSTSILVFTFLRSVKKMEEVIASGFVVFLSMTYRILNFDPFILK